ncbi:C-type lectin domain family 17, member A-like isoform X2 [Trichomycterus rosablanca]|uniref:C-type lectin domain family 17, member A-like isoform X2 n=1 Tax=Trichomycterus rosablanca TaxID=2290929 RepID=UPI002F35C698
MAANPEMNIQHDPPHYQNVHTVKDMHAGAVQNRRAIRIAGVCVGLMFILQGSLNIILRLYYTSQVNSDPVYSSCDTQPTYGSQLQSSYDKLVNQRDQIQRQRDELQQQLTNLTKEINKPGWRYFKSSIYYVSTRKMTWSESRKYCQEKEADLVIINSLDEQDLIEMLRRGQTAWIGLSDLATQNRWKWVDGTTLTTSFWWTQEPNNYQGSEDCVTTGYKPTDDRPVKGVLNTWNDESCIVTYVCICERRISTK